MFHYINVGKTIVKFGNIIVCVCAILTFIDPIASYCYILVHRTCIFIRWILDFKYIMYHYCYY